MSQAKTGHFSKRLKQPVRDLPDIDEDEVIETSDEYKSPLNIKMYLYFKLISLQEAEIKKVFSKVDRSGR